MKTNLTALLLLFVVAFFSAGYFFRDITYKYTLLLTPTVSPIPPTPPPSHCSNEKLYDNLDDALIEIGNACRLDLSYQGLKTFPKEITTLSHLVELRLDDNQITSLPPEIGNLKELQILTIRNNQITYLPPDI